MAPKLGIIAGGGELPRRLVEACRSTGRDYFILALEGQASPDLVGGHPHAWSKLGAVGGAIKSLKRAAVEEVVMAGGVRRPALSSLSLDGKGARLLARLGKAALGDDGLLRAVVTELEGEGFRVVGPDTVLTDLLTPPGTLGRLAPDEAAWVDIRRGIDVARALGLADAGQGVVVQDGIVLGVEAVEGTDALLARCGPLRRNAPGGVLVKLCKPGQERRVDLPAIGSGTVRAAAVAGLRGIAVEAGRSIILDFTAVIRGADEAGLFVVGFEP